MTKITCNRLVWVRDVPHEAGTAFTVAAEPKKPTEIDAGQLAGWQREGWLADVSPKSAHAASEGA